MGRRKPADKQRTDGLNIRVVPTFGEIFRRRAQELHLSFADYLEALIQADADGQVLGARQLPQLDELPTVAGEQQAPYGSPAPTAGGGGLQVVISHPYGAAVVGISGVRGVSPSDFVSALVKAKIEEIVGVG